MIGDVEVSDLKSAMNVSFPKRAPRPIQLMTSIL
jgi:hypothetical protein